MTRAIAFLIGCTALICGDFPTCAAGLGWKVLSCQSVKEPKVCFYGSANVFRANGLSVWTKCLAKEDLNAAVKADSTGSLSDIAAEKIAHDYVPPIAAVSALEGDQIVDVVIDEELANTGNIRPLITALREIDCAKRRTRELSVILPVDGLSFLALSSCMVLSGRIDNPNHPLGAGMEVDVLNLNGLLVAWSGSSVSSWDQSSGIGAFTELTPLAQELQ